MNTWYHLFIIIKLKRVRTYLQEVENKSNQYKPESLMLALSLTLMLHGACTWTMLRLINQDVGWLVGVADARTTLEHVVLARASSTIFNLCCAFKSSESLHTAPYPSN